MSKLNLDLPEVAIREKRLGSITGYCGSAKELVGCSRCGKLKEGNHLFNQTIGCSVAQAVCTVVMIQDAAVISHGPIGCLGCLHEFDFTYQQNGNLREVANPTQRKIFSTDIEEKDTIYGGSQKLRTAIEEVYEKVKPKVIFVATTCAVGIIGDEHYSMGYEGIVPKEVFVTDKKHR